MRYLVVLFMSLALLKAEAQTFNSGVITGTVLDDKNKALNGATAQLFQSRDSLSPLKSILTDENGLFQINDIPFGYYRLKISYIGFHSVTIDSIYFRAERYGFNLND